LAVFLALGPDPDGDFFVVEVVNSGEEREELVLDEAFATFTAAQISADHLNGDGSRKS
jgi:hypothetical protein